MNTDTTARPIIPQTYPERLVVTAYHVILANPQHHNQSVWSCNTGFCASGWMNVLAGGQFITSCRLEFDPTLDNPEDEGRTSSYGRSFSLLLGKDWAEKSQHSSRLNLGHIFAMNNTLEEIRRLMEIFLGYDPADALPDEDMLLRAKRDIIPSLCTK